MRRYFPRQRDETFAGRSEEAVASAGRRTGRPHRKSNAEKASSSRPFGEQVDRVDLYCELVLFHLDIENDPIPQSGTGLPCSLLVLSEAEASTLLLRMDRPVKTLQRIFRLFSMSKWYYKQRCGYDPKAVNLDGIYGKRFNRAALKALDIRFIGKPLGRHQRKLHRRSQAPQQQRDGHTRPDRRQVRASQERHRPGPQTGKTQGHQCILHPCHLLGDEPDRPAAQAARSIGVFRALLQRLLRYAQHIPTTQAP